MTATLDDPAASLEHACKNGLDRATTWSPAARRATLIAVVIVFLLSALDQTIVTSSPP